MHSGLGSYVRLLRSPGAATLALSGMIGRFPIAMRSISCLMLVSAVTGSLAEAGTVAAAMLVCQGVASPVLGRLADRTSQRRVLLTACLAHAVGMASLLVSIALEAPLWVLIAGAAAAGCTSVSFGSFVRARWAAMVAPESLRTAYAMESMLDDTIFLLGPLLATALASAVHPVAGLLTCWALHTIGSLAVALHRRSEPASEPVPGRSPVRAITVTGVWVLTLAYAGMGFLFGAVDVSMIAFAEEQGTPWFGGVLLALIAAGSLVSGLVYGAVDWRVPQDRMLSITTCFLILSAIPLALTDSSLLMAFLAVIAGVAISPALISGSTLLESVAPQGSLSESFSWLTSAGAFGIGSGTAVGGALSDMNGSAHGVWAGVGGGVVAVALSVAGRRALRQGKPDVQPASTWAVSEQ